MEYEDPYDGSFFVFEEPSNETRRQVRFATDQRSGKEKETEHNIANCQAISAPPTNEMRRSGSVRLAVVLLAAGAAFLYAFCYHPSLVRSFRRQVAHGLQSIRLRSSTETSPQLIRYIEDAVRDAMLNQFGPRDYAFGVDGGQIVTVLTSTDTSPVAKLSSTTLHPASVILRENLHGGRCWELPDVIGQVGIRLSTVICPSQVTVDHIPREFTQNIGSAPRHMRLWGALDGRKNKKRYTEHFTQQSLDDNDESLDGPPIKREYSFVNLADFEYAANTSRFSQTFPVHPHIHSAGLAFGVVVIEILDNWGGNSTCIYRIRLHGQPAIDGLHRCV